jgi:hypothetical protein
MKRHIGLIALTLIPTLIISSCFLTGNDNDSDTQSVTPTGTFTKEVVYDGTVSIRDIGTTPQARYMMLYLTTDIKGSGMINSISLRRGAIMSSPVTCSNVTIRMGHTDSGVGLSGTFANNFQKGEGTFETVLDNTSVTIPAGPADEYFTIQLSKAFNYNGVDNIIMEIARAAECTQEIPITTHQTASFYATCYNGTSATAEDGTLTRLVAEMKFTFSGGGNAIEYGGTLTMGAPFNGIPASQKVQLLYTKNEINGSGYIDGIAFPLGGNSLSGSCTVNIRIGHSTLTSLVKTSWNDNFNSGTPVTMASGITFVVPPGIPLGTYVWLPITNMFYYNGKDNLVVEIEVTDFTGIATTWRSKNPDVGTNYTRAGGSSSAPAITDFTQYDIKFRFYGGTMDVITDSEYSTSQVFNTDAAGIIGLYQAYELGTAGEIRSIACRQYLTYSPGLRYANYKVIIGHSNVVSLNSVSANNFVSRTTVFDGTANIPEGSITGDWIEIPLTTPFHYDGKSNLAVWLGTTAVSGSELYGHCIRSTEDASRYPGQVAVGIPGAENVTVNNYKLDMKFKISR